MDGVEGLVHISELANHHVENPREVVAPGDVVRVKVLEIDSERRRLSLSIKRVEGQDLAMHRSAGGSGEPADGDGEPSAGADLDDVPELGLSEDVFADDDVPAPDANGQDAADTAEESPGTAAPDQQQPAS
jgi:small subunit ribosomal protein S1